jgi:hypothetical protein
MFLRYFDFVFVPFRAVYNRYLHYRNIKGNIKVDVNRAKAMGKRGQGYVGSAQSALGGGKAAPQTPVQAAVAQGQAQAQARSSAQASGGQVPAAGVPGGHQMQGPTGSAGTAPPVAGTIIEKGFGPWKKRFCGVCNNELDKTWDSCPFCAQAAQQAAAAAKKPALRTQAFSMDPTGKPGQNMMLGWLVPLQGPHKGELYTLSPVTIVGNDPSCGVVLQDQYMSGKHAEVKVEGGVWVLKDLGSTNGTYVNQKRIDKHELVDNDFVKFGSSLVKFKCLS